jgi:hypothetical protein
VTIKVFFFRRCAHIIKKYVLLLRADWWCPKGGKVLIVSKSLYEIHFTAETLVKQLILQLGEPAAACGLTFSFLIPKRDKNGLAAHS